VDVLERAGVWAGLSWSTSILLPPAEEVAYDALPLEALMGVPTLLPRSVRSTASSIRLSGRLTGESKDEYPRPVVTLLAKSETSDPPRSILLR
jgi:hypothetical protein